MKPGISLFATFGALLISVPSAARGQAEPLADAVSAHVSFLADDRLGGRAFDSNEYRVAALYVASQMAAIGLRPANGQSWYQEVPFLERGLPEDPLPTLTIGDRDFVWPRIDQSVDGLMRWRGDAIFLGYAKKSDMARYREIATQGKVGVAMLDPAQSAAEMLSDEDMFGSLGLAGMVTIPDTAPDTAIPYELPRRRNVRVPVRIDGPAKDLAKTFQTTLEHDKAALLFRKSPYSYDQLAGLAARKETLPLFPLTEAFGVDAFIGTKRLVSPNIVGLLPGSDPKLANEYILVTAHLDHLGGGDRNDASDTIFNGAMDNALGVAIMLETARLVAAAQPKRSVIFAATTAEEAGLFGSSWMADHPLPGRSNIVAVVNLDMPLLFNDFDDVIAFGGEHSTLGAAATRAALGEGVRIGPDPVADMNMFQRSDQFSFVRKGIPGIFLMPGFANGGEKAFRDFIANHYHKVSDDLSLSIDKRAAAKFTRINAALIRDIANQRDRPRWNPKSEFAKASTSEQTRR